VPAALPHPVRGGTARVALVRLPLAGQVPSGRVDVPVALRYRPRYGPPRQVTESLSFDVLAPASFEEVPNPYLEGASGIPVSSASGMFFGREQIIGRVRERLRKAAGPGTGVAVFGQKRSGKSSIRLRLVDQLRRADGFPVVDIGNIGELTPADSEPDPRRLLATLIWRIIEGAEAERPGSMPFRSPMLRREEFLASPDPVYDCARLFAGYDGARPFVVCIDEFQYIEGWIRDGLIPASFLQLIKALVERRLFHLVIVGQSDLERLVRDDPNVFGVFAAERVSYLEPAEARQLAEVPILLEGASRFRERAADRVIELTGGNAFFVQRLGAELVEYMNAERAPLVTEADVDLVSDAFLDRLTEADFDNLESLGRDGFAPADYRAVLLAIARALRHGRATDEAVAEEYDGERLPEILRDLVSHEVIRRDGGGYRIVVGLYRDWLIKFLGS